MNVGICKVTLRLPENQSLKGKRRVISSLCSRIRNKYNVSIAEVGDNDSWQIATLGIACASNSARHVDETLSAVVATIGRSREDVEVVAEEQETFTGF
jgi:uncharacterized protein YlxP (DUF503 family)